MLSAASPPFPFKPTTPSPLREVQGLYRRVCVLRISGKTAEAELLQTEQLPAAIEKVRESRSVTDDELLALFASEEERVETANALAEILLPVLTAKIDAVTALRRNFPAPASPSTETSPSYAPAQPPEPSRTSAPMLPGIADFIDEMLVQDRAPSDSRNARRSA
jgi:hypothetical protein